MAKPTTVVHPWSVSDVAKWLIEIDLSDYVQTFEKRNIDGKILFSDRFTEDLQQTLIPNRQDRSRFHHSLTQLKSRLQRNIRSDSIPTVDEEVHSPSGLVPLITQLSYDNYRHHFTPDQYLAHKMAEQQCLFDSFNGKTFEEHRITGLPCERRGMPLSSHNYTISVDKDQTLEEIARKRNLSLDQLSAANPTLSPKEKLSQDQKIFLPVIQQILEKNDDTIVPWTLENEQLEMYREQLYPFFANVDDHDRGYLKFKQFKLFLEMLNLRTLNEVQIREIFVDMNRSKNGKLTFEELFKYFCSLILMENDFNSSQVSLFQAMLNTDHHNQCLLGGVTQFLNRTWAKFSHYRRYGHSGQLVMSSDENIAMVSAGNYSLVELNFWPDQLTENVVPKHVIVKRFQWRSKSQIGRDAKAGELILPSQFDCRIPIEIATILNLKYYGCTFANETQLKVLLVHQHEIADFHYSDHYVDDFVRQINLPGLERHAFVHLDCPHDDYTRNGHFVLGKIVNDDELHLTAFLIPAKHTLYIPPHTIHSNDYLRGKWRTMLAEDDIDRVVLKRPTRDGTSTEVVLFTFS